MLVDMICHQTLDNHQMRWDRVTGALDTAKTWIENLSHQSSRRQKYFSVNSYLLPVREMVRV